MDGPTGHKAPCVGNHSVLLHAIHVMCVWMID